MEDIPRTPRSRREKLGNWTAIVIFFPTPILTDALGGLGLSWWKVMGVLALVLALGMYLLSRPARTARRQRLEADLQLGVVDCAIRFPNSRPGSLADIWNFGAGQVEDNSLHFQAMLGDQDGTPAGRRKTFPHTVLTRHAPGAPSTQRLGYAQRGWRTIHLETDGGLLQVAASEESCEFLEQAFARTGGSREAGPRG